MYELTVTSRYANPYKIGDLLHLGIPSDCAYIIHLANKSETRVYVELFINERFIGHWLIEAGAVLSLTRSAGIGPDWSHLVRAVFKRQGSSDEMSLRLVTQDGIQ